MTEARLIGKLKIFKGEYNFIQLVKMRKLSKIIICLICSALVFVIFGAQLSCKENAIAAPLIRVTEENLKNTEDLIGTELDERYKKINAPFNNNTGELMSGSAFEPNTIDEFGQVDTTLNLSDTFVIDEQTSLFLWIFIPNEPIILQDNFSLCTFELSITLSKQGSMDMLSWTFNASTLSDMFREFSGGTVSFGWKFFELNVNGSDAFLDENQNFEFEFNLLSISYKCNTNSALSELNLTGQKLAVYHVLLADEFEKKSNIISSFNYANYKLTDKYINKISNIFVGDTFSFGSIADIFDFVYVGTLDVRSVTPSNYTWSAVVMRGDETITDDMFKTIKFNNTGWYSITISLKQRFSTRDVNILSSSKGVYVEEFTLGKFGSVSVSLTIGDKRDIIFTPSSGFILDGEYEISVADKTILDVTYYENNGVLHIVLEAKKKGTTTITVTASGNRDGTAEIKSYSKECDIKVNNPSESGWQLTVVWVTFGVMSAVLLIFMLISVVKARKNDVK